MDKEYESLRLKNQICFPLYAASREVIKQYRPFLDAIDLTYTQYIAMMVFWEEKKLSVKELGQRLFLDSGTLTPVLKSLEAKGYISRSRSAEDERILIASITEQGEALREQAASVPEKVASCVRLDADEAMQLYRLLYKILGAAESE
ncbi:MAG: MarR family transcriptional regulator [Ruminococcaceae bacterium]|nr:MarR family transcriptional regulator [Oscillospiraceae bacterium]